jgi:hypothetical protein
VVAREGEVNFTRVALAYAGELGWPVFPCNGKLPAIPKDEGGNGHLDATIDERRIQAWGRRFPDANIAIACDERSGLLALDVDPRASGDDELAELERENGELPHTITALSGGGGQHYLFKRPLGVNFRGKLAGCKGVDIKANGYIIVAPSIHPETRRPYRWEISCRPRETALAELPPWVLTRVISYDATEYGQPADDAAKSFLARAFGHAGWLGKRIDKCRINCWCPWESEHTQQSGSGGTIIFAPREGSGAGWFHCSHTSHGRKTIGDVLAVLPHEAVLAATADMSADAAESFDYESAERRAIQEEA